MTSPKFSIFYPPGLLPLYAIVKITPKSERGLKESEASLTASDVNQIKILAQFSTKDGENINFYYESQVTSSLKSEGIHLILFHY